mgnify:CR=1 FL=1
MGLIDSHTHLDSFFRRGELAATLQRAQDNGVSALVTVGTDLEDWELYRQLAEEHPQVIYHTVGLHPCSVDDDWARQVDGLAACWDQTPRPVALGECGLDRFHLPKNDPAAAERLLADQQAAFARQLELARELACPIVVQRSGLGAGGVSLLRGRPGRDDRATRTGRVGVLHGHPHLQER